MRKFILLAVFAVCFVPFSVFAGVFELTIVANPDTTQDTYTQSFKSVEDVIDNLDTDAIASNITGFDQDVTPANATIDFRGVPIYLTIAENDTRIYLSIPSIGVYEEFDGTDRDDSVDEIEDWLKENGQSAVTKLMRELVAETATDPIAGNPASLQSRMVASDYSYGMNADEVIEMNGADSSGINANMVSIFARYSNYDLDGVSSREYGLPLAYTIRFNNSQNKLSIRVPISMVDVDGSKAYNFGLGMGMTYFVKDNWSLTPAIGYSAVGSVDLASVGQFLSGSLTSSYSFFFDKYALTMGNMVGYYDSLPFKYSDYDIDADISNSVLRNGLNFAIPTDALGKGTSIELFVIDTRYFGSELYVDQYNEVGISYGITKLSQKVKGEKVKNVMRKARIGFTYLFSGEDVSGYSVNFGFAF